jgi:hypothetical protein
VGIKRFPALSMATIVPSSFTKVYVYYKYGKSEQDSIDNVEAMSTLNNQFTMKNGLGERVIKIVDF